MTEHFASHILEQIPASVRFNAEDAATLLRHRDLLLTFERELVQGFYDNLYGHEVTRRVFADGERPAREQGLVEWYRRTLSGPFDEEYWRWQTFVGLVHIKRKVNNAMVAGMWGWILTFLGARVLSALPADEALPLIKAVHALQACVIALITESYQRNMLAAVDKAAGLSEALLMNLVNIEIDDMLREARVRMT